MLRPGDQPKSTTTSEGGSQSTQACLSAREARESGCYEAFPPQTDGGELVKGNSPTTFSSTALRDTVSPPESNIEARAFSHPRFPACVYAIRMMHVADVKVLHDRVASAAGAKQSVSSS